ncbi:retron system putative HNH endonuclease [Candidatus Albibeggiatoa sp. nov. NOAA]|uniref:retron system putative HNH endonuclease n=1 Tax=Candidatus Albibeggiatoa sp. nov. NOAA TaxID=3162724 RepID=UPI00330530E7|nr:TIGR02646 family protein [Thiotrichaceae bacterium]
MRFIQKTETPQFFLEDIEGLENWNDYFSHDKRTLKTHILQNEQNYLCVYCESKVSEQSSHIEHIKPKETYASLTFEYSNLSVSCNGTCHNIDPDRTHHSCGHRKNNEYDENKFLDPTKIENIREYFIYSHDENDHIKIQPSDKDKAKAEYMIDTLRLNDDSLAKARKNTLVAFQNSLRNIKDINKRKQKIRQILEQENKPFISFLVYKYKPLAAK